MEKCENCKYFRNWSCHIVHPGVLAIPWDDMDTPNVYEIWPPTRPDEWCGEYRPKDTEEAE